MSAELSAELELGRVADLADDELSAYIEILRSSMWVTISARERLPFSKNQLILINLEAEEGEDVWTEAPDTLKLEQQAVGNIRLKNDSVTVIEFGGRHIAIPTTSKIAYEVDNTVSFSERVGVTSVISSQPIATVDPFNEDSVNIDAFRVKLPDPLLEFRDFAGSREITDRAKQLVELPLQRSAELTRINANPIQGVIFSGPPGTGKTLLARIIACEAGVPLYVINGGQLASRWWGQSERTLRRIFESAAEDGRAIIVVDEIDTIGGKRHDGMHEGSSQLVTALLTLMDGFQKTRGIVVIGTTNRVSSIDPALRRPGRFDWEIEFRLPSVIERRQILAQSGEGVRTLPDINHFEIASETDGWSPADLTSIWSEASYVAAADARDAIGQEDYQEGFRRAQAQKEIRSKSRGGEGTR